MKNKAKETCLVWPPTELKRLATRSICRRDDTQRSDLAREQQMFCLSGQSINQINAFIVNKHYSNHVKLMWIKSNVTDKGQKGCLEATTVLSDKLTVEINSPVAFSHLYLSQL